MKSPEELISTHSTSIAARDEFQWLCQLSRPGRADSAAGQFAASELAAVDWPGLLRLAEQHGVLPLVTRNLSASGCDLPGGVAGSLDSAYKMNLARSLMFAGKLIEVQRGFERAGVKAVPYKGAVLAQVAYGDLGLRRFSDLDFLVRPAEFEGARAALAELGYTASKTYAPAVERSLLRTGYERAFDGKDGKNLVELQWALVPYFYAVDLEVEDLIARAGRVAIGDAEVPCLSPEDSLLALCLHAAKHLWTKLIWLADIARSLNASGLDFHLAAERARQAGIARIVGVSLRLAESLLQADIPGGAHALIRRDPEEAQLADEFARRLAAGAGYDLDSAGYFRQIGRLRERTGDRLRYYGRLAWTPSASDLAAVRLPRPLFPFYRAVRAGRLVKRTVQLLQGRGFQGDSDSA